MSRARQRLREWWGGRCPACLAPLRGGTRCAACGAALPARYRHLRRSRAPLALAGGLVLAAGGGAAAAVLSVLGGSGHGVVRPAEDSRLAAITGPSTTVDPSTGRPSPDGASPGPSTGALLRRRRASAAAGAGASRRRPTAAGTATATTATTATTAMTGTTATTTVTATMSATTTVTASRTTTAAAGTTATTTTAVTTSSATTTTASTTAQPLALSASAATTYVSGSDVATACTTPADAIDGSDRTGWSCALNPGDDGAVNAGLLIDLGASVHPRSLSIVTSTPWMAITVDGTTGAVPASLTDPGWIQLATIASLRPSATVTLRATSRPLRHLLVWIDHAPPGVNSGRLGISKVTVSATG